MAVQLQQLLGRRHRVRMLLQQLHPLQPIWSSRSVSFKRSWLKRRLPGCLLQTRAWSFSWNRRGNFEQKQSMQASGNRSVREKPTSAPAACSSSFSGTIRGECRREYQPHPDHFGRHTFSHGHIQMMPSWAAFMLHLLQLRRNRQGMLCTGRRGVHCHHQGMLSPGARSYVCLKHRLVCSLVHREQYLQTHSQHGLFR